MSEIIIDNWGLSACAHKLTPVDDHILSRNLYKELPYIELCWQNFLTSIVVWDKIFYDPINHFAYRSIERYGNYKELPLFDYLCKQEVFKEIPSDELSPDNSYRKLADLENLWYEKEGHKYKDFDDLIFRGFIYVLKANRFGYSYLPHPLRAAELEKYDAFQSAFNANLYLDILDKDVCNIVENINKEAGKEIKNIPFPLLYHFIHSNASNPKEELELALHLRKQKDVMAFRKSVDKINDSLNKGDILELKASIEQVHQISKEITNKMYKKPSSFSVSLGITPSITSSPISLNIEKNSTHIEPQIKKVIHTTFLTELASFGLQGQKSKRKRFIFHK